MHPSWIIQTNMGGAGDIADLAAAVARSGAGVCAVTHVPFSPDLPDAPADGPVVLYGATSFVLAAHGRGRWTPGAFSDADTFTWSRWVRAYGAMLLNAADGAERVSVREFVRSPRPDAGLVFVRPEQDTKGLNGGVRTVGELRAWCRTACTGAFAGIGPDTGLVVGEPYGIEAEWRLFVAGREIVGASLYRRGGRPERARGAPDGILEFGRLAAARWEPAPIYVLDVCLSGGHPYVVEAQGYNSAGHYAADLGPIVDAVNAAAVAAWRTHAARHGGVGRPDRAE